MLKGHVAKIPSGANISRKKTTRKEITEGRKVTVRVEQVRLEGIVRGKIQKGKT